MLIFMDFFMKNIVIFFFLFTWTCFSQSADKSDDFYLEDQLYLKISYNFLSNMPESMRQSGFSNGFSLGFIKDLPLNKGRNFGFGIGVGYGRDTYFHNLKITQIDNITTFDFFTNTEDYQSNKLKFHSLEVPFEIRWRTSTIEKYKFWRIYSGVKFKYVFSSKASYQLDELVEYKNIQAINKLQYGITISAGYGTFNFFMYYGLTPLFDHVNFNSKPLDISDLKLGLQFYIL